MRECLIYRIKVQYMSNFFIFSLYCKCFNQLLVYLKTKRVINSNPSRPNYLNLYL